MIRYRPVTSFLESGLILASVELPEYRRDADQQVIFSSTSFDWLVVVSQECDLQRDRDDREAQRRDPRFVKESNLLRVVLVCPAFRFDSVASGTYLPGAKRWGGTEQKILQKDGDARYHRLLGLEGKFGDLLLDFRLLSAAHPTYLGAWMSAHAESAVAVLEPPFRDRLIQRFVGYLGRIPEPEEG